MLKFFFLSKFDKISNVGVLSEKSTLKSDVDIEKSSFTKLITKTKLSLKLDFTKYCSIRE